MKKVFIILIAVLTIIGGVIPVFADDDLVDPAYDISYFSEDKAVVNGHTYKLNYKDKKRMYYITNYDEDGVDTGYTEIYTIPKDKPDFWAEFASVRQNGILYVNVSVLYHWKLFCYDLKNGESWQDHDGACIKSMGGDYFISTPVERTAPMPEPEYLYQFTDKGSRKIKKLGSRCWGGQYINGYFYYAKCYGGKYYSGNHFVIYRMNGDGTGLKKLKSIKAKYCVTPYSMNDHKAVVWLNNNEKKTVVRY